MKDERKSVEARNAFGVEATECERASEMPWHALAMMSSGEGMSEERDRAV